MKVLVAADGSSHSQDAFELLQRLRLPAGSEIVVLNVLEDFKVFAYSSQIRDRVQEQMREGRDSDAQNLIAEVQNTFDADHFQVRTEVREGHVAEQILAMAEEEKVDLIVVGSRGMSALDRFLLGSTSFKVLKHAPCPVLMSRPDAVHDESQTPDNEPLRIMLCWDGSPECEAGLETLTRLPLGAVSEVRIVSMMALTTAFRMDILQTMSDEWRDEQLAATEAVEKAAAHLKAAAYPNVTPLVREAEDAADGLLDMAASWPADIIMVGAGGKSAIDRFLLGSISTRITHHAPCAVWLTRTQGNADA